MRSTSSTWETNCRKRQMGKWAKTENLRLIYPLNYGKLTARLSRSQSYRTFRLPLLHKKPWHNCGPNRGTPCTPLFRFSSSLNLNLIAQLLRNNQQDDCDKLRKYWRSPIQRNGMNCGAKWGSVKHATVWKKQGLDSQPRKPPLEKSLQNSKEETNRVIT